jgi:hypothetical protein
LRSTHRPNKRLGGGRFLLSQYFHHDGHERRDRGASPSGEAPKDGAKGKERITNGGPSASGSDDTQDIQKSRTSSSESKYADNADNSSFEEEGRRSTSLEYGRRSFDRSGQPDQMASLDASRIVSMALNLSEGRRRNISGGHLLPPQSSPGHRAVSGGIPTLHGHYNSGVGGSLRKHLQDQRKVSRTLPNESQIAAGNRLSSLSYTLPAGSNADAVDASLSVSHGTVARVEKAKQYIELSAHYRELLDYLPPLKPRARYAGPSSHGRPDAHSHHPQLGRGYNPLQLVRNRKSRVRERLDMRPDPTTWDNAEAVKAWLQLVELYSEDHRFIEGEEAMLPTFPTTEFDALQFDEDGDGSTKKYKRPRVDWIVSPPELLADAYWLEQDKHKSMAEDRNGNKLFPTFWTSNRDLTGSNAEAAQASNSSSPRYSMGSERARDSDGLSEKRGREHSGEYPEAPESSAKLKQAWQKARGRSSSSSSGLSYSDDESGNRIHRRNTIADSDFESTAPLEKHLSKLIDAQSSKARGLSPSIISPGTPDKWGFAQKTQSRVPSGDTDIEPLDLESWKTPDNVNRKRSHLFTPEVDDSNTNSPVSSTFGQSGGPSDKAPEISGSHSPKRTRRSLLPFAKQDGHKTEKPVNWPLPQEKNSRFSDTATPPRQSLEVPGRLARPPTRDSHLDADSPRIAALTGHPHHLRRDSKDRGKTKSFAAGLISSVNDLVRSDTHGRLRRKKDLHSDKQDIGVESPRRSFDDSEAEQSSGSGLHLTRNNDKRHKNSGLVITASRDESLPSKGRPRLLERIELPTFRPTASPSTSQPGTPEPQKLERRLLPAFRPLSRSNSTKGSKLPEAPTSMPQTQPSQPTLPTISDIRPTWHLHQNSSRHHTTIHSSSDLARLRALLLCSGIKASGIMDGVMAPRPPVKYLEKAIVATKPYGAAGKPVELVPFAHQPQTAAAHLSASLNTTSRALHSHHATIPARLTPVLTRLTLLRSQASALVDGARYSGDDAVNTTALITGQKTIEVRQVIDALDSFKRKQRRRLRWIRRAIFAGLEWGVLMAMWLVWLVVVIINVVWKSLRGVVRIVRWAIWL